MILKKWVRTKHDTVMTRQLEHIIKGIGASLPIPAIILAPDESIVFMNAEAQDIFGEGLEGRHFSNAMRAPSILSLIEQVFTNSEDDGKLSQTITLKQDNLFKVTVSRIIESHVAIYFQDQNDRVDAMNMRRDFVANVSHELKTPLTALIGFIETLGTSARKDEKVRAQFLQIMSKEAERMDRLVSDLLSLSKVEATERMRPTEKVTLEGIIEHALNSLDPMIRKYEVRIKTNFPCLKVEVLGDFDQLLQVSINLIENAVKYGGIGQEVTISLSQGHFDERLDARCVTLSVRDNGNGIDLIHIPRLTERFYRVDTHRSREVGGTGLGLAIVKHIVSRHRGRLEIESKNGKGSLFKVILPLS